MNDQMTFKFPKWDQQVYHHSAMSIGGVSPWTVELRNQYESSNWSFGIPSDRLGSESNCSNDETHEHHQFRFSRQDVFFTWN